MMKFRHFRWLHQHGISRRKLRDTWLHRLLGERLFGEELWTVRRESMARGWLVGCLVATTPLLGTHLLMGVPLAILTRANLLLVIALLLTTNPLTAGVFYPFAFLVGCLATGHSASDFQWASLSVWHAGVPLFAGCSLIGGLTGLTGWLLIRWLWISKPAREISLPPPARTAPKFHIRRPER